ncbi:endonuclease/exonuclease/phosphatase family protein [Lutimaribacter sp. EGI FJ00015]|uniref:Endonuclease/exonuclease/phosphatase family protein n=1 Tax=Lutimaribacter degradans TaxID=2945989 RepID=A0ACC5ZWS1_9RHOB|nr:endonuclease/exonuclease/phosphatase family protein [Lutimaribacter sp. EGI FJ00013]MCM2562766.1 endonuclease/exonuclease/phosphatase family protein [Lutimaribacter sp. EGI FJ00013]MCO0613923.1 endonuclease/exonuclease/phosphatase family protein [Lutimaribacter sp. EGI FJ00015]MCO0636895.1 endonuclease/exonuclease/phosphatase family protein [Lutimaribacter sp. EGI FJ00014]
MRIGSFNLQNLRLRGRGLDGAHDHDTPDRPEPRTDQTDRRLGAQVIGALRADVLALQEVFDQATLDHFHDAFLRPAGVPAYPHRHCLPGNDGRGQDVALLSRIAPLRVGSHASLRPADLGLDAPPGYHPDTPIFRRDCLEVALPGVTLFICHFKAPGPDPETAWPVRRQEALAVRHLVQESGAENWLILGDLNEPATPANDPATAPVLPPFSVDLMARRPRGARWSAHDPWDDVYWRADALLASPALARAYPDALPEMHREGLSLEARRHTGAHLAQVGHHRPHASDHAALVIDLPGLGPVV